MRSVCLFLLLLFGSGTLQAQQPVRNLLQKCFGKNCQQSAGFVVGDHDTDGAIVTSVGPVANPLPSMAPPLPMALEKSVVASALPVAHSKDFRTALLKAARQERGNSLTVAEYFSIFVGSLNAQKLEHARLAVIDSGIQDGTLSETDAIGAIDWEKLIELIIKYLPMILDLFKGK